MKEGGLASSLQKKQKLPSPSRDSPLQIYIYDMPSEFTTRNLQYRTSYGRGPHRIFNQGNTSMFFMGSLYAAELALHEWLLDSPLRTLDGNEAHLFYVPIYLSSLFLWPVSNFADSPWLGRHTEQSRKRSYQGTLLMLRALSYIRSTFTWWNASDGRDHIWLMLHDEGPCFCPREIRSSILLTHYGYYAQPAKPMGTFGDDNFLHDRGFYNRWIGNADDPAQCFKRGKDIVIPPWKIPNFWKDALRNNASKISPREGLFYFAGELGARRDPNYSHGLRQKAYAHFCHPNLKSPCSTYVGGCNYDVPLTCEGWKEGITIEPTTKAYHKNLASHTFCLAFPGDGWSSRVLDGIIHGCIPVIIQDDSYMFFQGAFSEAGMDIEYEDFSVRVPEKDVLKLADILSAIPLERVQRLHKNTLIARDYFVYKDMYNPNRHIRKKLLEEGRPHQDAFLLLTLNLEARARALGKLPRRGWRNRAKQMLGGAEELTTFG